MAEPTGSPHPEESPAGRRPGDDPHRDRDDLHRDDLHRDDLHGDRPGHDRPGDARRDTGLDGPADAHDAPPEVLPPPPPRTPVLPPTMGGFGGVVLGVPPVLDPPPEPGGRTPSDTGPARAVPPPARPPATPVAPVLGADPDPDPDDATTEVPLRGHRGRGPHRDGPPAGSGTRGPDPLPPGYPGSGGRSGNGHGSNGHTSNSYGSNGHASNGHGSNGHSSNGHSSNGHASNGYPEYGHGSDGHPGNVYEGNGHGEGGHDANGRSSNGYSDDGRTGNGHWENGHAGNGHAGNGQAHNGHGENGHAGNGHAGNGHAGNGHAGNGHGENGHAGNGHAGNGHGGNGHAGNGHAENGQGGGHAGGGRVPRRGWIENARTDDDPPENGRAADGNGRRSNGNGARGSHRTGGYAARPPAGERPRADRRDPRRIDPRPVDPPPANGYAADPRSAHPHDPYADDPHAGDPRAAEYRAAEYRADPYADPRADPYDADPRPDPYDADPYDGDPYDADPDARPRGGPAWPGPAPRPPEQRGHPAGPPRHAAGPPDPRPPLQQQSEPRRASGAAEPASTRTGGHSPYEIVPTPARGIPPVGGRSRPLPPEGGPAPRGRGAAPPFVPLPPAAPAPPEPAGPEPFYVAYRVPVRGTVAGIHVEQLVLWQVVVLAGLFLYDAPQEVLIPAGSVAGVVLLLTATRFRGQWTHRYLLHRLHLRRRARASAAADVPSPLTVQDARLGRRRRLAAVFDGKGWSGTIRVASGGPTGDLPLVALVRAAERFLDDVEHDFADVQIVHTLVPAGRIARTRDRYGVQDRELPPLVAQTWMTCRVHCVDGRRSDRPVPDLLEVRRDLRRAIDGVIGNLVEQGVEAHALATRQLYDDCVLSAGGRHEGPEPVTMPAETSTTDVERRPAAAAARSAGRTEERPADCEAVEIDYSTDLGDSVHAALALDAWPDEGFAGWLRSLSQVPARAVSLVVTLERSAQPGVEAGVAVRHTTGSEEESAEAHRVLRELADEAGVGLRRADTRSHESLLATLPLGSSAAQYLLGPATRHLIEPEDDAEVRLPASGVALGHDATGTPFPVPLLGPEPVWTAVVGGTEVGAALVASALAGWLQVQVVTPQPRVWERAFVEHLPDGRLDVRPVAPDRAPAAFEAVPGIVVLDDYGADEVLRPALRAWQAGVCRIDPGRDDVEALLHGVSRVIAVRCTDDQARGICAALGLGEEEVGRFVAVPDGVVTVAGPRGAVHVELDAALIAELGMRVTRPPAPGRAVRGPMMVG